MKNLIFYSGLIIFLFSCNKNNADINNPDVQTFVQLLKSGTYNVYEKNEKGENLWLKLPNFSKEDIPLLIQFAKDTSHIKKFPTNPISSRLPYPDGRDYFILGECLLWVADGMIGRSGSSLDPYIIDTLRNIPERYKGVTTNEILAIQEIYEQWWNANKNTSVSKHPLADTPYRWM